MRIAPLALAVLALAGCAPAPDPIVRDVTPIVIDAGVHEDEFLRASAYVEGVKESGGTCRYTFWADWGGATRLTSKATLVEGRTECGPVEEHIQPLRAGEYELIVSYSSDAAEGESEPYPVSVPEH